MTLPWPDLAGRATVIFLAVLVLLRLAGKRHLAQLSPSEFVAVLLVSNAVQNAMNGGDTTIMGGLVLTVTIVVLSWAVSWMTFRFRTARSLFEGTPTLLVHRGRPVLPHLAKEHLSLTELEALLREQGIHRMADLDAAVLEADGHLSVIRRGAARRR